MKSLLILYFLFLSNNFLGQQIKIDTLKVKLSDQITESGFQENNYYPLIKSGNKEIDSLINFDLKNKITNNDFPNENIESTLNKWAAYGLVFLDFKINYDNNGILSLRIDGEGCAAYCTNWSDYYNYSTITGKVLDLADIVDLTYLQENIIKKKNRQYQINRELLKKQLQEDDGLDESDYNSILERYNECDREFEINQFALFEDHLEIIDNCYLLNMYKPSTPIIDIQYKYSDIQDYLKIKN